LGPPTQARAVNNSPARPAPVVMPALPPMGPPPAPAPCQIEDANWQNPTAVAYEPAVGGTGTPITNPPEQSFATGTSDTHKTDVPGSSVLAPIVDVSTVASTTVTDAPSAGLFVYNGVVTSSSGMGGQTTFGANTGMRSTTLTFHSMPNSAGIALGQSGWHGAGATIFVQIDNYGLISFGMTGNQSTTTGDRTTTTATGVSVGVNSLFPIAIFAPQAIKYLVPMYGTN